MLKKSTKETLKVVLSGMDERTRKTLTLYLQGPCKAAGVTIVDFLEADLEIIDADLREGRSLLDKRFSETLPRPLIVLSLQEISREGVFYIKKPVQVESMLDALDRIGTQLRQSQQNRSIASAKSALPKEKEPSTNSPSSSITKQQVSEPAMKRLDVDASERNKSAKHQTAMQLSDKGFSLLLTGLEPLDIDNTEQLKRAAYNPKEYFQGFVQSAIKVAKDRDQVLQLHTGWKQMLILPRSNEIWLDADDKQLRAFSGLAINKNSSKKMSISWPDPKLILNGALDKFQSMEAIVWKLACWTSKGRYPRHIDIERPVYLKQWPNLTRLVLTPHALRIAALLIDKPVAPIKIAGLLHIKPEYVFVFISAASALGLLKQSDRNADSVIEPPELKPSRNKSLLSRIIDKLRVNKPNGLDSNESI